MSSSLVVSHAHIGEKDLLLLEFLLTLVERQTSAHCTLTDSMDGNLVIIDIDQQKGLTLYNSLKARSTGQILIPLTEQAEKSDAEFILNKPLRSAEVIAVGTRVLEKQAGKLTPDTMESPAPERASPVIPAINFKQSTCKRLFNFLTDSNKPANYVEISLHASRVYVDFQSQQFLCENKLISLSMLFKSDINELAIRPMESAEYLELKQQITPRTLNELIIDSALLGSSGELTADVSVNEKLDLSRWPGSIERLPKHLSRSVFAIAAFMTKHQGTISDISLQSQATPEVVAGFINACAVLGYLSSDNNQKSDQPDKIQKNSQKRGLFAKIRTRFGLSPEANHSQQTLTGGL